MLFTPKAALTLGIATMLGSGILFEAPAANAQVRIEINVLGGPGLPYRDYWSPYLIDHPDYWNYYRGRDRRPEYFRHRAYRNYSRFRHPNYRRSYHPDRRPETRVKPRFNTRDFYRHSW